MMGMGVGRLVLRDNVVLRMVIAGLVRRGVELAPAKVHSRKGRVPRVDR